MGTYQDDIPDDDTFPDFDADEAVRRWEEEEDDA